MLGRTNIDNYPVFVQKVTGVMSEFHNDGISQLRYMSNYSALQRVLCANVTGIPQYCFRNCYNLSYVYGPRIVEVHDRSFENNQCSILTVYGQVFLSRAFTDCSNLTILSLPCATNLSNQFVRNTHTFDLYLMGSSVCNISPNAFSSAPLNTIYVPSSLLSDYQTRYTYNFIGV